MSYSEHFFNKPLNELQYQDIADFFITPKFESDRLECKSYEQNAGESDNFKNIKRVVGAFLNSDGGLLIWGSPQDSKTGISGELKPLDKDYEKDKLVSKISDGITPLPKSINVQKIKHPELEQWIYIFDVTKSAYPPHQTDHLYYMRIDGQTKPAPHYYVEALFKQIKQPNLVGHINFIRLNKGIISNTYDRVSKNASVIHITIIIANMSPILPEKSPFFSISTNVGTFYDNIEFKGKQCRFNNIIDILHSGMPYETLLDVVFDPEDLYHNNYEMTIQLFFGGEFSSVKISDYHLTGLDNPANDNFFGTHVNTYQENILMSDRLSKNMYTIETALQKRLIR